MTFVRCTPPRSIKKGDLFCTHCTVGVWDDHYWVTWGGGFFSIRRGHFLPGGGVLGGVLAGH